MRLRRAPARAQGLISAETEIGDQTRITSQAASTTRSTLAARPLGEAVEGAASAAPVRRAEPAGPISRVRPVLPPHAVGRSLQGQPRGSPRSITSRSKGLHRAAPPRRHPPAGPGHDPDRSQSPVSHQALTRSGFASSDHHESLLAKVKIPPAVLHKRNNLEGCQSDCLFAPEKSLIGCEHSLFGSRKFPVRHCREFTS